MSLNIDFVKIQDQHFEDELEEEESLSLCDLPISEIIGSNVEGDLEKEKGIDGDDSSFDFGLLTGSVDELRFEMCSADEVFSGGQLLPFRHSVSSEGGLSRNMNNSSYRSIPRSGSIDRDGLYSRSTSTSTSTRSNSIGSQYSSTSTNSTSSNNTSISVKTFPIPKKIRGSRNNFHSHPSPKPHVWATGKRATGKRVSAPNNTIPTSKTSKMWEVLRLGLVRTPEIELHQDLKQRHRTSTSRKTTSTSFVMARNNSSSSTSSSNNNSNRKMSDLFVELQKTKIKGGLFNSCKCSVLAVEPAQLPKPRRQYGTKISKIGGPKSGSSNSNSKCKFSTNYVNLVNEDKEIAQKKGELLQVHRQGKKVMSHHYRTFEWLRDLSNANVLNA